MSDIEFSDHGSVVLVIPHSQAAIDFIWDSVYYEGWQIVGGGIAVEPRLAVDIYLAAKGDGLTVDGNMGVTDAF